MGHFTSHNYPLHKTVLTHKILFGKKFFISRCLDLCIKAVEAVLQSLS